MLSKRFNYIHRSYIPYLFPQLELFKGLFSRHQTIMLTKLAFPNNEWFTSARLRITPNDYVKKIAFPNNEWSTAARLRITPTLIASRGISLRTGPSVKKVCQFACRTSLITNVYFCLLHCP